MAREIWEESLRKMEEDSLLKAPSERSMSMMSTDLTLKESTNPRNRGRGQKDKKCC
jgi:hypothetical protein